MLGSPGDATTRANTRRAAATTEETETTQLLMRPAFNRRRSEMPYMYEHFDWTHCKLLGYNMDNSHFTYNVDTNTKQRSGSYIQT